MQEIWKDIPNYEGLYQASSLGRVRSLDRTLHTARGKIFVHGKILSPNANNKGYLYLQLSKNGRHWPAKVHRLVAMAFLPNDSAMPEVNHKDGNKLNNAVENLEWCTHSQNHKHSVAMGLSKIEIAHKAHQREVLQIDTITNNIVKRWNSIADASEYFCGNRKNMSVWNCLKGNTQSAFNYKWKYADK